MLVSWPYRERDTFYQRLDPRSRILFSFLGMLSLTLFQVWDLRILAIYGAAGGIQLRLSRVTLRESRTLWSILLFVAASLTLLTLVTGKGGGDSFVDSHLLWQSPWLTLSVERLTFAVSQFVRIGIVVLLFAPLPYTLHPARYGLVFHKFGVGDKFAVATDLAFRFVPNLAQDFETTMEAQKARGYELDRAGGLWRALRNLAPLLVPVTIGTILKGEDVIDALDLRAFGSGPRTWYRELHFRAVDWIVSIVAVGQFVTLGLAVGLNTDVGRLWVPPWFL